MYGISQNPSTKDYIMVLQDKYHKKCVKCGKKHIDMQYEWYDPCPINNNFRNEKVDNFIQEMQLKINDLINVKFKFKWIPYNQFNDIKEIRKSELATVYSAVWKDGPLCYLYDKKEWIRESNKKAVLRHLHNSQNIINEFIFIDKVQNFFKFTHFQCILIII